MKRLYGGTNKREATGQIAKRWQRLYKAQQAWQRRLIQERRIGAAAASIFTSKPTRVNNSDAFISDNTVRAPYQTNDADSDSADPELHYYISASKQSPKDVQVLVKKGVQAHNPAFNGFLSKLQDHILGRLLRQDFDGDTHEDFTSEDRNSVRISGNQIYSVKTCRVFYTTYDLQHDFDLINPTSHPDVMVCSPETEPDASPYWYARVIGIYHANVWTTHPMVPNGGTPRRMEFLWVRWFGTEPGYQDGRRTAWLPKIGFVESVDEYAFGFLDPNHVVRGCHLIPDFVSGRSSILLPTASSAARILNPSETNDWTNFYVNM